jgi:predicted dehydrogenase
MADKLRIGIIGAGNFTVSRILPGFQQAEGCVVTTVANRRKETAEKVAAQFGIEKVAEDWHEVVESEDVDAVFIGTPPYLHWEATLAALAAGKHVLCETRIATTAAEARDMHAKADEARARGVQTMLVPPAPFYKGRRFIEHLVKSGFAGKLRHVQSFNMSTSFADPTTPLSVGRNNLQLYGPYNAAQLGLSYDVMVPWTGHAARVLAQRATFTTERPETPGGPMAKVPYPDEVTVIAETQGGAVQMNLLNWAAHFGESRVEIYGENGTIVYKQRGDVILGAQAGQEQLQPLSMPQDLDGAWRVEEEFVRLCIGEQEEASFTFWDGVKNMEYLEAAYKSATEGGWVDLR